MCLIDAKEIPECPQCGEKGMPCWTEEEKKSKSGKKYKKRIIMCIRGCVLKTEVMGCDFLKFFPVG